MEPAEAEHAILSMDIVTAAHVMMLKHPATNEAVLVAYVTPAAADPQSIRQHCNVKLAKHMVPSFLVTLEAFPALPSGKIDTRSLPEPEWSAAGRQEHSAPPQDLVHRELAAIWERVLQQTGIGIHDDFFEVGGSSLLAGQLATAVRQDLGVSISSMLIFQQSTIAAMAQDAAFSAWQQQSSSAGQQKQIGMLDAELPIIPQASSWSILPLQLVWIALVQGLYFFSLVSFLLFLGQFSLWYKGHRHLIAAIIVPAPFLLALVILWLLAAIVALKWTVIGRLKPGRYI